MTRISSTAESPAKRENTTPHDLRAEQSVLGACMLSTDAYDEAALILRSEHFYAERHQLLWRTMGELIASGKPTADAVVMAEALDRSGNLESAGGVAYILELLEVVPHAGHVTHYAEIVLDRARRRSAWAAGVEIVQTIGDLTVETDDLLFSAETRIHDAITCGTSQRDISVEAALISAMGQTGGKGTSGIGTGYTSIDVVMGDMDPGDMIVIGARPSVGKTAFAMDILRRAAESRIPCHFASYEMTSVQIAERLLSRVTGLSITQLRSPSLSEQQREMILQEATMLSRMSMTIDDKPHTLPQLLANLRTTVRKHRVRLVAIDYLQMIRAPMQRGANREQEVALISRTLKETAKQLGVAMVVLSQLNRTAEHRENAEPKLSDLRESGAIEQDADKVLLLWRPNKDAAGTSNPDKRDEEFREDDHGFISIAKNRNGKLGRVRLGWDGSRFAYSDWQSVDQRITDGSY